MKKWHENPAANVGLRIAGLALLGIAWSLAVRLHHMGAGVSARDTSALMLLFAAMVFLCGSAGSALMFVGPGLWDEVEVSERWRRLPEK